MMLRYTPCRLYPFLILAMVGCSGPSMLTDTGGIHDVDEGITSALDPEDECDDAVDGDVDSFVDCGDEEIESESDCTDGEDIDADEAVDCDDSDCTADAACTVADLRNRGIDADEDGFPVKSEFDQNCLEPTQTETKGTIDGHRLPACDCNDGNPGINVLAKEIDHDDIDSDCDGDDDRQTKKNVSDEYNPHRVDDDGDGYPFMTGGVVRDCDDTDADVHPHAETDEAGDGIDQNCDGVDGFRDPNDLDRDGDGYSQAAGDCDDTNSHVHPGLMDNPRDDLDNDCDGVVNNPPGIDTETRRSMD